MSSISASRAAVVSCCGSSGTHRAGPAPRASRFAAPRCQPVLGRPSAPLLRVAVRVGAAAADNKVETNAVTMLNSEDAYRAFLESAGDAPVLVDHYTNWCGPCKVIYPHVQWLASKYPEVKFAKFECSGSNAKFASEIGVKALPSFFVYRKGEKSAQYSGANKQDLTIFVDRLI